MPHTAVSSGWPSGSPPIKSSSAPARTATSKPGFSTRKNRWRTSCPSIAGAWGTIATTAWICLTSINASAESPWYSQDHSVLTEMWSRVGSGWENKETSTTGTSLSPRQRTVKNRTSPMHISSSRSICGCDNDKHKDYSKQRPTLTMHAVWCFSRDFWSSFHTV